MYTSFHMGRIQPCRPKKVNNKILHLLLSHVSNLFLLKFGKFDFFYVEKSQFETKWWLSLNVTALRMQLQEPNDCLLFTWANRSVHGLGRWISSRKRTHEFHLPKNRGEMVKLVSKMGLEYYDRENWTTLTFRSLCSFEEFCTDTTPKIVFHLLFILIFREYFCKL